MNLLLKKLNYKAQNPIIVLNAPASFEPNLQPIADATHINRQVVPPEDGAPFIEFALFFATRQSEVDTYAQQIAPYLKGDAILWACYPKGSSPNAIAAILTAIQVGLFLVITIWRACAW